MRMNALVLTGLLAFPLVVAGCHCGPTPPCDAGCNPGAGGGTGGGGASDGGPTGGGAGAGSATGGGPATGHGAGGGTAAILGWTPTAPDQRRGSTIAWDGDHNLLMLFGGKSWVTDQQNGDQTWTWDGTSWTLREPQTRPNINGTLVWDRTRHRMVLYDGGAETWEWDGSNWKSFAQNVTPMRSEAAMAWHGGRSRVVLFGGTLGTSNLNDLWEWDGATWTLVPPGAGQPPTPRRHAALTWDETHNQLVLVGGYPISSTTQLQGTWLFGPTGWADSVSSPVEDFAVALAWDPVAHQVAWLNSNPREALWNGTAWSYPLTTGGANLSAAGFSVAAMAGTSPGLVLFGAAYIPESQVLWKLHESVFSPLQQVPSRRAGAAFVWMPSHHRALLVGGLADDRVFNGTRVAMSDAWEFDGKVWSRVSGPGEACVSCSATWDPSTQTAALIGFGANGSWTVFSRFDGTTWTALSVTGLPDLKGATMGFNDTTQQLFLVVAEEVFELTGTQWAQKPLSGAGPGRRPLVGYDPMRHKVVAVGGGVGFDASSDETWELGTSSWTKATPAQRPSNCNADLCQLVWMPEYQALGLFERDSLSTWDGTNWTTRAIAGPHPEASQFGLTRDPDNASYLLFGGVNTKRGQYVGLNDTWRLKL
jgi:hypothetical protein